MTARNMALLIWLAAFLALWSVESFLGLEALVLWLGVALYAVILMAVLVLRWIRRRERAALYPAAALVILITLWVVTPPQFPSSYIRLFVEEDDYREAIERENITWPNFWDGGDTDGPISTKWSVFGWPTIFVLDHEGIIRGKGKRGEELHELVDELLFELTGRQPPAHVEGDGELETDEEEHGGEEGAQPEGEETGEGEDSLGG